MLHIIRKGETKVSYMVTYEEVGTEVTIYTKRWGDPAVGVTLTIEELQALVPLLGIHLASHGAWVEARPSRQVEVASPAQQVEDASLSDCYYWDRPEADCGGPRMFKVAGPRALLCETHLNNDPAEAI